MKLLTNPLLLISAGICLLATASLARQPASPAPADSKPADSKPAPARSRTTAPPDPRAPFIEDLKTIASPGIPGSLALWGDNAFIVAIAHDNKRQVPVIAAANAGKGRIVAFGHNSFLASEPLHTADTGKLVVNAIRWAAGDRQNPRIGVLGGPETVATFNGIGITVTAQAPGWPDKLGNLDVLIAGRPIREEDVVPIQKFIASGGGFVTAQTGWGWQQIAGGKDMMEFSINHVLAPFGLAYTDGYTEKTCEEGFDLTIAPLPYTHGGAALEAILASGERQGKAKLSLEDSELAAISAMRTLRVLPADESNFRPRLTRLLSQRATHLLPADKNPLRAKANSLDRFLLAYQLDQIKSLPPDQIKAHPAAAIFPGAVSGNARKVTRTATIDTVIPQWHSLGLYAPPGSMITITIPPNAVHEKLGAVIGCHTDQLWDNDEWHRVPEISKRVPLVAAETTLASAFGGLIYIDVPDKSSLGAIEVTIAGAVESPLFVLGKTTPKEWKTARGSLAPWAELATSKVIVSVPTDRIRNLEDPTSVLKFWDEVMDADADLAGISRDRPRPERYAADVQISVGYMHSGYPIMTHLDAAEWMVSLEELRKGNWGLYHEMGHNHQDDAWTFDGTGEVTCNLFTLYVHDMVCDQPQTDSERWLAQHREDFIKHIEAGAPYEKWKEEPFIALVMYVQLQRDFGWATFKKVFAEYRQLPPAQRPHDDQQKRDQWMVRFSRACGRNLGPFFQAWGVPTSQAARDQIKNLPEWMPEDWPKH